MSAWKGLLHVLIVSSMLVLLVSLVALPGRAEKPQPDVTADSLSAAARMSDEIKISPSVWPSDYDNYLPAVAYSAKHHQFLIVWQRKRSDGCREIWGRRVSEGGQLLSQFNISSGPCPQNRIQPAVAYNAKEDNYLVVWMYHWSGTSLWDPNRIDGRTVKWDGSSMGSERVIISWLNRSFWTPRMAWNSIRNEYMVVWTAFDTTTGQPHDVAHAILNAYGDTLLTKIITINQSPQQIDVTYNVAANEYFTVWRRMWTTGDGDIMGARINPISGDVVSPPWIIAINTAVNDQKEPRITTNQQHRYLVVWSQVYDPAHCCDWDIRVQELDVGGGLTGSHYGVAMTLDDEESPSAIARPGTTRDYMVAWQRAAAGGQRVEAIRWGDSGYTGLLDVASATFWNNMHPVLAVGGPFLIAYESDSLGDPTVKSHIFARLYWPHTTYLPAIVK